MREWKIPEIAALMEEAGKIAMRHYESPRGEMKSDQSVVTDADKEIESFLGRAFDRPEESVRMIGEETSDAKGEDYIREALSGVTWIVDPIDGTAPYYSHMQTWGTSIALMVDGRIQEGAIFMPALDEFHITMNGKVFLTKSFSKTGISNLEPPRPRKRELHDGALIGISQVLAKRGRFTGKNPVQALCCCVYSMCHMAQGGYLGYHVTAKLWDIAAGLVILNNCGIKGYFPSGRELTREVVPEQYFLDGDPKKRWKTKDSVIFAADWKQAEALFSQMEMPPQN